MAHAAMSVILCVAIGLAAVMLQGCGDAAAEHKVNHKVCEGLEFKTDGGTGSIAVAHGGDPIDVVCPDGYEYVGHDLMCGWVDQECAIGGYGRSLADCEKWYGITKQGEGLTKWPHGIPPRSPLPKRDEERRLHEHDKHDRLPFVYFNCDSGLSNFKNGWSSEKINYCCKYERKACEVALPATVAIDTLKCAKRKELFDCNAGIKKWKDGWSTEKKAWCCKNHEKGCAEKENEDLFDCEAGLRKAKEGWSSDKKEWCCKHSKKGCLDTLEEKFDVGVLRRQKEKKKVEQFDATLRLADGRVGRAFGVILGVGLCVAVAGVVLATARRACTRPVQVDGAE